MTKKIGFAVTGSFCCHQDALVELEKLVKKGYDITPIITPTVSETSTRFGTNEELKEKLRKITGKEPVDTIVGAEPLGPKNIIEAIVIAPCTGNTLAKLANGISDNAVTMATKSLMRNHKPVVIALSSNDALGLNLQNLAKLINTKGIYFVPFKQDNFAGKPKSLVANWSKIEPTLKKALRGDQIQPVID